MNVPCSNRFSEHSINSACAHFTPKMDARGPSFLPLPVPHPDFVAIHPRRIIAISDDGSWSVVEPLLIASLDYDNRDNKSGNGKSKKRRKS